MSAAASVPSVHEQRALPRDEVHFRARGLDEDAHDVPLLVVNVSAQGLMARCERAFELGERLHIKLPVIGEIVGEVRWALGGRVGFELMRPIPLSSYYQMLGAMLARN